MQIEKLREGQARAASETGTFTAHLKPTVPKLQPIIAKQLATGIQTMRLANTN